MSFIATVSVLSVSVLRRSCSYKTFEH